MKHYHFERFQKIQTLGKGKLTLYYFCMWNTFNQAQQPPSMFWQIEQFLMLFWLWRMLVKEFQ
jgi:hypothetical protein